MIESYVSPKVEMRHNDYGKALFAKEKILENEIVSISGGIVMKKEEWSALCAKNNYSDTAYSIEEDFVITPIDPDNPSDDWAMNHCCFPNVGVRGQITFIALRDIEEGEELTYDYAMTETDPQYNFKLSCYKEKCRSIFTGNDWKTCTANVDFFSLYVKDKLFRA